MIKFRGKGTNTGKWYYGYYYEDNGISVILRVDGENLYHTKVIPDSVQQFIGYDKNGNEIYDGDLVIDSDGYEHFANLVTVNDDGDCYGIGETISDWALKEDGCYETEETPPDYEVKDGN